MGAPLHIFCEQIDATASTLSDTHCAPPLLSEPIKACSEEALPVKKVARNEVEVKKGT